jgi:hypothetical protein
VKVDRVAGNGQHLDAALGVQVVHQDLSHDRKSQRPEKSCTGATLVCRI